jgi:hypothetical protein
MRKHRIPALVIAALALSPVLARGAAAPSDLAITNYESPMYLSALPEPFTFTGTCPKDVKKITVDYFVPKDSWGGSLEPAEIKNMTLKESYVLLKYVPGSGTFIYRVHPTLNNLLPGTNVYRVTAERGDSSKLTAFMVVYYSEYMAERGGEEGAPGAERGGPDDGA